ncbi:MAG: glutamate-5-semialdehyde dehydrogenase [Pedosphaera sp.]|nr:glutamate-5-semialdehyde dehydrogenase [Pedosphaera sp.]
MAILEDMTDLARRAKAASRQVARLTSVDRNRVLLSMADALQKATVELQVANALDREVGRAMGLSAAMLDRLTLDSARIIAMAQGVRDVATLPDPVNRVLDERIRPNGLRLRKIAVPIGVVVIIYESRPNVTADAASLCLKTGNATILRGGKEALNSNRLIASIMVSAARAVMANFPEDGILVVPTADREAIPALLSLTQYVDLCMPRGGEGLIRAVTACSKVPVIKHYKGVCHVYVQGDADLRMAEEIVFNAKCQRPSTCNAAETLLVDQTIADRFLPQIASRLATKDVSFHADIEAIPLLRSGLGDRGFQVQEANSEDWSTEYNDYVINVRIVKGLEEAIQHITDYGSGHSDAIITADETVAERFLSEVDSAAVYWNASTRFTDGGEFGMGAEIGISTDKIGARGPMGLEELCTYKWQGFGTGQIRS